MNKLIIEITEEDRRNCSHYTSATRCLLSTAVQRQSRRKVSSGGTFFTLWDGEPYDSEELAVYHLNKEDTNRIMEAYQEFTPFTVEAVKKQLED